LEVETTKGNHSEKKREVPMKEKKAIALDTNQRHVMIHPEGKMRQKRKHRGRSFFSALRKHAPRPSGVAHEPFREKIT
jgi:hypothetical protein